MKLLHRRTVGTIFLMMFLTSSVSAMWNDLAKTFPIPLPTRSTWNNMTRTLQPYIHTTQQWTKSGARFMGKVIASAAITGIIATPFFIKLHEYKNPQIMFSTLPLFKVIGIAALSGLGNTFCFSWLANRSKQQPILPIITRRTGIPTTPHIHEEVAPQGMQPMTIRSGRQATSDFGSRPSAAIQSQDAAALQEQIEQLRKDMNERNQADEELRQEILKHYQHFAKLYQKIERMIKQNNTRVNDFIPQCRDALVEMKKIVEKFNQQLPTNQQVSIGFDNFDSRIARLDQFFANKL